MTREKRAAGSSVPELPPVGRRSAIAGASVALLGLGATSVVATVARGERVVVSDESLLGSHGLAPATESTVPLLGVLAAGASITAGDGHRYTLGSVYDVRHGGVPVVLVREDGAKVALEILRFDATRPAPGRSGALAVHVPNRGDGATSTDESAGLAAMALARVLVPAHAPPSLETLAERCARAPLGTFDVPA
jgi:hypothetical protein